MGIDLRTSTGEVAGFRTNHRQYEASGIFPRSSRHQIPTILRNFFVGKISNNKATTLQHVFFVVGESFFEAHDTCVFFQKKQCNFKQIRVFFRGFCFPFGKTSETKKIGKPNSARTNDTQKFSSGKSPTQRSRSRKAPEVTRMP